MSIRVGEKSLALSAARAVSAAAAVACLLACASGGSKGSAASDSQRYLRLAQLQLQRGQTMQAIESTRKAIELDSGSAEARYFLGVIHLTSSEFKEAAQHFRDAVRINPYFTDAHNSLGVAYKELKEYDRARAAFDAALRDRAYATPEKIHLNMGHLNLARGDGDGAIEAFRQALALRPDYSPAMLGLGMAYEQSGRPDLARREFERVVRAAPDSPEAARARQLLEGQARQAGK